MSENRSVVSGETQGPDSSGSGQELRAPQSAPGHVLWEQDADRLLRQQKQQPPVPSRLVHPCHGHVSEYFPQKTAVDPSTSPFQR